MGKNRKRCTVCGKEDKSVRPRKFKSIQKGNPETLRPTTELCDDCWKKQPRV